VGGRLAHPHGVRGRAPGRHSFPLDGSFATYLGWLIPWGTPLTLLGDTPEQVTEAQRELARIGIDRLEAQPQAGPPWARGEPPSQEAAA
jgi:hypothetical protein